MPMAKAVEDSSHIITCTAINKTFNTAGLHCTNVIITDPDLRAKYALEMGMQLASPFAISAVIAVYNEGEDWLDQLKEYIDGTMEWIETFLKEKMPKVKTSIPDGTYVMWLDFGGYGLTPDEIHDRIYNQANVLLEDGHLFGEEGSQFQRICTPSPRPLIQEAMTRIAKAFEDLS